MKHTNLLHVRAWLASFAVMALVPSTSTTANETDQAFRALVDESWDYDMRENPLEATATGDHRFNDRLPDVSLAAYERRQQYKQDLLKRVDAVDRDALSDAERVNYDVFRRMLNDELSEYQFHSYLIPITGRSGFHISFPELRRRVPLRTAKDYEGYIARLRGFKTYVDQHIELMRRGMETGHVLPDVVLEDSQRALSVHVVEDPADSLLYEPLRNLPETIEATKRDQLRSDARTAISESVVGGYQTFLTFMQNEYVPKCRPTIGASELPNGKDFYRYRVRHFTTLDRTPEEVHQQGLEEVRRIREEMAQVIERTGFKGGFAAFVDKLRTDEEFYASEPQQLLERTAHVCKKMDGKLPQLFGRLPRMSYGLRVVPAYIAPRTTSAYYEPPTGDGTKAGYYFVNTYDLASRPLYGVEALSLHEAVPGHHLQIALQQELEDLPNFRRFASITAFVEGWALYAERLGLEVGFYEDPYSDFGRLTYEMWRACRLVVDTGIHYMGWSRQDAIDFMAKNSALSLHNIRAEVDRYIAWPGQALAYKTGELKIRELRKYAEEALGEKFDVRAFHDVVLGSGAVPLGVLHDNVHRWVERTASSESVN